MRDWFSDGLSGSQPRTSPTGAHNPGFTVYRDAPVDPCSSQESASDAEPALVSQDQQKTTSQSAEQADAPINPSSQLTTPQRQILYSAFTFATPEQGAPRL